MQIQISKKLSLRKAVLFHSACNTPWAKGIHDSANLVIENIISGVKTMTQNFTVSALQSLYEQKLILTIIFVSRKLHNRNWSCWTKSEEVAERKT